MKHLDLFSGIGGFAYAIDQVWNNTEHVFCDNEPFAQEILAKHWPGSEIYNDIRDIKNSITTDIVTGGFPCQPFSHAGQKRGTTDNRYLWPEMLRVIQLTKPTWVIAENVYGLVTWNGGMVLEQVCTDLETSGYEVQPFIIPAVAVNAPHRRDRVWVVARHTKHDGLNGTKNPKGSRARNDSDSKRSNQVLKSKGTDTLWFDPASWEKDWLEVATEFCVLDDGLSKGVDRARQIKGYGNAIVPQVAIEILKAIKKAEEGG